MDRSLMADATSPDESPTSGYQLSEIARMTKASYDANVQVQKYLVERLAKPNHNTKFKALMIIKHVCRTGRPEFKREMGRNVDAIRECLQFKGPPDPLRGDEIYRRVRECAREVLEALFDGQMPVTTSAVAAANRIQGIGSDFTPPEQPKPSTMAYLSSLASAASTAVRSEGDNSPKYAGHPGAISSFGPPGSMGSGGGGGSSGGFGNPNFADARNEKSWLQRAGELASTAANAAGFGKSETSEPLQGSGGGGGGFAPRTSGTFSRSAFSNPSGSSGGFDREAFRSGASDYNYATNRGPNAIHANSAPYNPQGFPAQQGTPMPSGGFVPDMPVHASGFGRAGGALDTGDYEKGVIDSLCEPGGLRPVPPEDKLVDFLNTASTLNEDIVGNCLLDVLNDESWQSRTKALIVVARLVKQPDCGAHRQWWLDRDRLDVVESLQSDAKANVRTQASKTLRAIDPTAPVTVVTASNTPPVRKGPQGRTGSFTLGQVQAAQPDSVSEMGTTITEDGSQAISDSGVEGDQNGQPAPGVAEPVPVQPAPPQEMDLLGFDDEVDTSAAPLEGGIPSTVQVTRQVPVSPLAHEYTGGEVTPQYSTVTIDTDELFAGMSVGETPTTAPTTAASAMLASPTYIPDPLLDTHMAAAPAQIPAPVPAAVTVAPAAPVSAPAPASASAHVSSSVFDFLDSAVSQPSPQLASAAAPAPEVDLFGSLTIADHTAPVPAAPQSGHQQAPSSSMSGSSTKSLFDDFAGLTLTPTSAAGPGAPAAPAGYPAQPQPQPQPQYQHQQQQQHQQPALTPEQQLLMMQGPPPPGANAQGLYLTRPVAPPAAPYAPYGYPPRGVPPGGVPARPMMPMHMPVHGGVGVPPMGAPLLGVGPRPVGAPVQMQAHPQPAIQLRQGASVIAPGMLSHTAERKVIPDAAGAQGSSGFGFMGGAGSKQSSSSSGADSFSFVTDAMRAQKQ